MSKLIVFAAPSGAGKTTIVRHLMRQFPQLTFSISATTRQPRPGEEEGKDYYFLSTAAFREKIKYDEFVEWEEVYTDQYYGTLRDEIARLWAQKCHITFDIDVKGALNIKKAFPEETLTVFVKAPSIEALYERLRARNTESEEQLQKRMDRTHEESSYAPHFDRILINDDLLEAFKEAEIMVRDFIGESPLPESEYPER